MAQTITVYTTEKFHSAEQMWFWFMFSKSIQSELLHNRGTTARRPCELLDIETLVTKLYLCGKLTDEHLAVMKKFGDRRRAPNQYIWAEHYAVPIWCDAMRILESHGVQYGWVDEN